jgi:hypothetical protein
MRSAQSCFPQSERVVRRVKLLRPDERLKNGGAPFSVVLYRPRLWGANVIEHLSSTTGRVGSGLSTLIARRPEHLGQLWGFGMPSKNREERIRALAYAIWEQEGRPDERAGRHWRMAEMAIEALGPHDRHPSNTIAEAMRSAITEEEERHFVEQELGAREALQAVENALVDASYDHFVVATRRGTWAWVSAD